MNAEHNAIFSGKVNFLKSAPKLEFLPDPDVPEIAFAGRSNVGKSSLINALLGRKAIARTSVTPGRTQELNFFDVGEPPMFRIVDMPGYGYAKAPIKTVQRWRYLINDYLRGRQVLARTFLLIDARRGIGPVDLDMMAMLNGAAVSYRTVLTKTDKVKQTERRQGRGRSRGGAAQASRRLSRPDPDLLRKGVRDRRAALGRSGIDRIIAFAAAHQTLGPHP